jgi:hypothetical protein
VSRALSILAKSSAVPPDETGCTSFEDIREKDAALFLGSFTRAGGATQETMRFVELERSKCDTVSKMGFKDGPDAVVYLSVRSSGKGEWICMFKSGRDLQGCSMFVDFSGKFENPVVSIPSLVEEEEEDGEEEDPDAIPPPLSDDEDAPMADIGKGRA